MDKMIKTELIIKTDEISNLKPPKKILKYSMIEISLK
jgi:hypothetical protein